MDVLIIGGGFAGLAAGVALAESGCRVRLLEQKPYLGGRARSFVDRTTGSVVDNGQHMFMGCYHATIRFLSTIGTLDRVRFQECLTVVFLERNGQFSRLKCPNLPAPWHVLLGVLRSRSFAFREKLEILRLGMALRKTPEAQDGAKRLSVREWLTRLGQSRRLQHNFWDLLCIAALNEDPEIASAVLFERVLRLALFTSAADSRLGIARLGLSEVYVDGAADFIRARGGSVECGRAVSRVVISEGRCRGVLVSSGEQIEAESVVSAVACFQLASLLPGELLSGESSYPVFNRLRPAPIVSINLWFDRPITDLDFAALRGATIQWLFNKGKISGQNSGYVSLVLSGAHRHIATSKEELLATALRELGDFFPEVRRARLLHSLVIKERFATFSPACDAEEVRPATRTPIQGLFLAGDWTATGLPATIEGAVQSGYAAAGAVLENR